MPKINLTEVKGYTSQDDKYPAENLTTKGQWLSSTSLKSTSIEATFQLEHSTVISAMNIGNCGSAHIAVFVSRTGCSEFKTFLPCSTFMSQKDSKQDLNRITVRMFGKEHFPEDVRTEKWDQLKVKCTQPFNLHTQFGLSFLHVFNFADTQRQSTIKSQLPAARSLSSSTSLTNTPSSLPKKIELQSHSEYNRISLEENELHKNTKPATSRRLLMLDNEELHRSSNNHISAYENTSPSTVSQVWSSSELQSNNKLSIRERSTLAAEDREVYDTKLVTPERVWQKDLYYSNRPSTSQSTSKRKKPELNCNRASTSRSSQEKSQKSKNNSSFPEEDDDSLFKTVVISFIESLNLQKKDFANIKLVDLRIKLEKCSDKKLSDKERATFALLVNKYMSKLNVFDDKSVPSRSVHDTQGESKPEETVMPNSSISELQSETLHSPKVQSQVGFYEKHSELLNLTPAARRNQTSLEDLDTRLSVSNGHRQTPSQKSIKTFFKQTVNGDSSQYTPMVLGGTKRKVFEDNNSSIKHRILDSLVIHSDDSSDSSPATACTRNSASNEDEEVECPHCKLLFKITEIVEHTDMCSTEIRPSKEKNVSDKMTCPICGELIDKASIGQHAIVCAEKMFGE